jgi:hypothetical protein
MRVSLMRRSRRVRGIAEDLGRQAYQARRVLIAAASALAVAADWREAAGSRVPLAWVAKEEASSRTPNLGHVVRGMAVPWHDDEFVRDVRVRQPPGHFLRLGEWNDLAAAVRDQGRVGRVDVPDGCPPSRHS